MLFAQALASQKNRAPVRINSIIHLSDDSQKFSRQSSERPENACASRRCQVPPGAMSQCLGWEGWDGK